MLGLLGGVCVCCGLCVLERSVYVGAVCVMGVFVVCWVCFGDSIGCALGDICVC